MFAARLSYCPLQALREWVTLDHTARIRRAEERVDALLRQLTGLAGVTVERVPNDADFGAPAIRLRVPPSGGRSALDLAAALEEGEPSIVAGAGRDALRLNLITAVQAPEALIAERLRALLAG